AVRRIEEVDAGVQRLAQERTAGLLAQRPGVLSPVWLAVGHAAQAKAGNLQTCLAQIGVKHDDSSCLCWIPPCIFAGSQSMQLLYQAMPRTNYAPDSATYTVDNQ